MSPITEVSNQSAAQIQPQRVEKPKELSINPTYANLEEATKAIINRFNPWIVSFGECHPGSVASIDKRNPTTSARLAAVMKLLSAQGFKDGVIEGLLGDKQISDELRRLAIIRSGISTRETPAIQDCLEYNKDPNGVKNLIMSAVTNGIDLIGSISLSTLEDFESGLIDDREMSLQIMKAMRDRIINLVKQQKRVFSLSGANHNDTTVHNEGGNLLDFGSQILKTYPDKYVEIDIVIPKYARESDMAEYRIYAGQAPQKGVAVFNPSPMRYIIVCAEDPK